MIYFGTPFQRAAGLLDGLLPLPLDLPITVGDAVVVKREFATSPHLLSLLAALVSEARDLATGLEAVQVVVPATPEVGERSHSR